MSSFVFNEELGEPLTSDIICSAIQNDASHEQLMRILDADVLPDSKVFIFMANMKKGIKCSPILVQHGLHINTDLKRVSY